MTGSGKTGLGIGLIEEAAMDRVPVIAIDPKGDLGNLLLTFPGLAGSDLEPWVDAREAERKGMSVEAYADAQAALWRNGLEKSGQGLDRIERLRSAAEFSIYTPGSSAGRQISLLRSLEPPPPDLRADPDLYGQRVQTAATGLLALLDIDADPLSSREHILIATLLRSFWDDNRHLTLESLIGAIQSPPFATVGVFDLDSFYPEKDRFALAMKLNNLLAAPGMESWRSGTPLNVGEILYTDTGKPRVAVMSIAHLDDRQRMFFVTMLLGEVLSWMRSQPGTSSLRAMLYMDEIFGYMPPTANPPSKNLLLTLLKQARAYGLGLVLSTQNPVDLDYKGLANTGTWFIGRMQTERDKARVMDGLEGVGHGGNFDRPAVERTIAGLGKRTFLMHNIHERMPALLKTRWVMSYLRGPLTREQIRRLTPEIPKPGSAEPPAAATASPAAAAPAQAAVADAAVSSSVPNLAPNIDQYYLPVAPAPDNTPITYYPFVIGAADIAYSSARYNVSDEKRVLYLAQPGSGPVPLDWDSSEPLRIELEILDTDPVPGATHAELPPALARLGSYRKWTSSFKRWLRASQALTLLRSKSYKLVSVPAESERDFRIRLQTAANEKRDELAARLRKRYGSKINVLENRIMRAEQRIAREQEQASQKKFDTAIAVGTAILGAFLGRKRVSATSASRVGSAVRSAGRVRKETADVKRARQMADRARAQLDELNEEFESELSALDDQFDAQAEELLSTQIRPKASDVHVHFVGIGWAPYRTAGRPPQAAWDQE
jgi:hypothetical protein